MKGDSQLITLPVAAVIATLIMVGMPIIARLQPQPPADPWLKLRPPTAEAGGRVLHNGRPIKGAVVSFVSTFENPRRTYSAIGVTNTDGRFLLNAFRGVIGAPLGPQKVSIQYLQPTGRVFYDAMLAEDPIEGEELGFPEMASGIPRRYGEAETSGLTATITADGPNDFLFELFGDPEPPDPLTGPSAGLPTSGEQAPGSFRFLEERDRQPQPEPEPGVFPTENTEPSSGSTSSGGQRSEET